MQYYATGSYFKEAIKKIKILFQLKCAYGREILKSVQIQRLALNHTLSKYAAIINFNPCPGKEVNINNPPIFSNIEKLCHNKVLLIVQRQGVPTQISQ